MANVDSEPGRSVVPESSCVDPTTEISDRVLADGRIVELIGDGSTRELKLLVSDGTNVETASSVRVEGQIVLPVRLDPGIQRAVTLPSHASDYGSTKSLFSETRDMLTRHGISEDIADSACYYVFSTWFPE